MMATLSEAIALKSIMRDGKVEAFRICVLQQGEDIKAIADMLCIHAKGCDPFTRERFVRGWGKGFIVPSGTIRRRYP